MQRTLLTALLLLFSSALFAQINLTVEIHGIDKDMENNVRLYLSLEQQKRSCSWRRYGALIETAIASVYMTSTVSPSLSSVR